MWTGDDIYFMNLALDEAYKAERANEVPTGAVLASGGIVIGRGHNCPIGLNDPSAHAEINALRSAGAWLKNYRMPANSTLYVTLEPCLMCYGAIVHARVDRIVFGTPDSRIGISKHTDFLSALRLNHQAELLGGLMEKECSEMLQRFFKGKR